jgi:hypothetical protein
MTAAHSFSALVTAEQKTLWCARGREREKLGEAGISRGPR